MGYKRKYKRGEPITSLDDIMKYDYFYVFNSERPKHVGFVQSLQFRVVYNQIKAGMLYKAEKISEEDD